MNEEDLMKILARKAEISMLNKLNMVKVNKYEIQQSNQLISNLNERVKHIAVLQNALAYALKPINNSIGRFDTEKNREIFTNIDNIQKSS